MIWWLDCVWKNQTKKEKNEFWKRKIVRIFSPISFFHREKKTKKKKRNKTKFVSMFSEWYIQFTLITQRELNSLVLSELPDLDDVIQDIQPFNLHPDFAKLVSNSRNILNSASPALFWVHSNIFWVFGSTFQCGREIKREVKFSAVLDWIINRSKQFYFYVMLEWNVQKLK